MRRNQGDHLKWHEVKAGIIKFIINRNGAVPEPKIRDFLGEKYGIKDQGNIKKHLSDLQHRPYSCIEKIKPKPGFANKWNIKTIENLKNIRLHFPEIQLTKYDKSLNILIRELLPYYDILNEHEFRVHMFLSISFFDICLKNDYTTLYDKYERACQLSEGFDEVQRVQKYINEIYTECVKDIFINPNIWLSAYSNYTNDSNISEQFPNSPQSIQNIGLSEEKFKKMLINMHFESKYRSSEKQKERILEDISTHIARMVHEKLLYEISEEMLKNNLVNFQNIPKQKFTLISNDFFENLHEMISNKLTEEIKGDRLSKLLDVMHHIHLRRLSMPCIIFEHCVKSDIFDGTVSPEEIEFMNRKKEINNYLVMKPERDSNAEYQAYNNFYIDYFKECREKVEIQ